MAEIRYSGTPTKAIPGVGAGLQTKWANFLGADLPMGLIQSLPMPGSGGDKRQQLIQALLKLLQEEEGGAGPAASIVSQLGAAPPGSLDR